MEKSDSPQTQSSKQSQREDARYPNFTRITEIHDALSRLDRAKGWPPHIVSDTSERVTPSVPVSMALSAEILDKVTHEVLRSKEVQRALGERWVHVNTQHVSQRQTRHSGEDGIPYFEFRVLFYSYSSREVLEILVAGGRISINRLVDIYIPETSEEITEAIRLATMDPAIAEQVSQLEAHAILEPRTDETHPSFNNRVIRVMFTAKDDPLKELPLLFYALVDLNERRVLTAKEAPRLKH